MDRSVVLLYCGGALLETLGEPLFNLYNQCFRVECRLKADAAGLLVRSAVSFVAVICYDWGVLGFGLAQLSYGLVHVLVMLWSYEQVEFSKEGELHGYHLQLRDLCPRVPLREGEEGVMDILFGAEATRNAVHMTGTSLLKHGLTEADKIALSLSSAATHYDQGVYAVINNYGSLVARMIFQPVEETARWVGVCAWHSKCHDFLTLCMIIITQIAIVMKRLP
jgi:oligosaccharide translocation protein RFT1